MPKIFCRHRRLILADTAVGMTYRCARCFALRPHAWRGLSRRQPAKAEAMSTHLEALYAAQAARERRQAAKARVIELYGREGR
jgi:hypothetical protein